MDDDLIPAWMAEERPVTPASASRLSASAGPLQIRTDTGNVAADSVLDWLKEDIESRRPASSSERSPSYRSERSRPWRKPKEEVDAERAEADQILSTGSDAAGSAGVNIRALLVCLLAQESLDELPATPEDTPSSAALVPVQAAVDALRQAATNAMPAEDVEDQVSAVLAAFDETPLGETLRYRLKRPNVGKYDICHRVLPGLWLGGWMALNNHCDELRRRKVTHVVSVVSTKLCCELPAFIRGHLHILANDDEDAAEGLSAHFPDICRFVDAARSEPRGIVYIHCGAGISRAPTVVASYLMWKLGVTAADALRLIKRTRPNIRPNLGFVKQLLQWEAEMLALPGGGTCATGRCDNPAAGISCTTSLA